MLVFSTKKNLKDHLASITNENFTLGMVPTMGALHRGHLDLVARALSENDYVVVSIFVNPTQFDNLEDLNKYPKTLAEDTAKLSALNKDIIVFAPTVSEIYPEKAVSKNYNFGGLERVMEGAFRAGHFDGVGTVVEALLSIVMPNRAYFGEKDFQQLQIIKKLLKRLSLPIAIIGCPIVRESNGLAMSSRNQRLPERLRNEAAFIYKTLKEAKAQFGTKSATHIVNWASDRFEAHPEFKLEYFSIVNAKNLKPVKRKRKGQKYRAFIAVYLGGVRLIDNIALN